MEGPTKRIYVNDAFRGIINCSLFGAVALVAAFPDVIIQALVLGVPKVGPEVEAHLTEQLGEAAVAVLYVLVGGEVHIKGRLDFLHAFLAQRLQRLLELGQRIDAGDGKDRCPGEGGGSHRPSSLRLTPRMDLRPTIPPTHIPGSTGLSYPQ